MAGAHWVHAERRTTCIAQTAPFGSASAPRSPSPVVNAATGPGAQEQQGSSQPPTEQVDSRTATPSLARPLGSASRARPEMPDGRRALAMATELLRYRSHPTAMTNSSIASRSSSLPPMTQRCSPPRSDPSRP
ncbi:hypothetical protein D1007_60763 [Hordeum vulgare]|nr:hypothetical protein D1007_60763 [Hordeum vulgare]